jgi:hypothetical protein
LKGKTDRPVDESHRDRSVRLNRIENAFAQENEADALGRVLLPEIDEEAAVRSAPEGDRDRQNAPRFFGLDAGIFRDLGQ